MRKMRGIQINDRHQRAASGMATAFTLIEILVVLVVLLIGILAVVRLFPPGFLIISRSAEMTGANALVENQLNAEKNLLAVQESIVAYDPATGNILSNVLPDDLRDFTPGDPAIGGVDPYYVSNGNRYRKIMGETFHIPIPTSNAGMGQGAVYPLQFGPVYNVFFTQPDGSPGDSLVVRGVPLQRTEQTSVGGFNQPDPTPVLQNDAQYAIDYQNLKIAFYPRVGNGKRVFVFAYSYYYIDPTNHIAVKTPAPGSITVPDVASTLQNIPQWQKIFKDNTDPNGAVKPADFVDTLGIERNDEDVSRQFALKTTTPVASGGTPNWSNDPYEYAWFSPSQTTIANVGVLIFNPIGHNQIAQTPSGSSPLTARVDYDTFDNHIIRDDRNVPSQAPYTIRLSLPFILVNGDVLDNQASYNNFDPTLNPYNGMFRTGNLSTPDLLIYNMNTGQEVGNLTAGTVASGTGKIRFTLDANTGQITLNQQDVEANNLQSVTLRFFYRAKKDWAMQVQKASAHYAESPTNTGIDYHHYYIGGNNGGPGLPTRIYFAPCDAGKTVVLGEFFVQTPAGVQRFANESYQITGNPTQFDAQLSLPYIDITTQHPTATGFSYTTTGRAVSDVQGGSLKSRVVWRSSQRWRKVDNDTFLQQQSLR